jgi:hypothetical protein
MLYMGLVLVKLHCIRGGEGGNMIRFYRGGYERLVLLFPIGNDP